MLKEQLLKWTTLMIILAVIVIMVAGFLNMTAAVLTALVAVFVGIVDAVLRNLSKKMKE